MLASLIYLLFTNPIAGIITLVVVVAIAVAWAAWQLR
jgi:hypothetical protein